MDKYILAKLNRRGFEFCKSSSAENYPKQIFEDPKIPKITRNLDLARGSSRERHVQ